MLNTPVANQTLLSAYLESLAGRATPVNSATAAFYATVDHLFAAAPTVARSIVYELRDRGYRVDYPLTPAKVARQFQAAEDLGARVALLYGDEWPQVKIKNMGTGEQELVAHDRLLAHLQAQSTLSS